MGFQSFQLSPKLVAELYPKQLVLNGETEPMVAAAQEAAPFEGRNLKRIAFLVRTPGKPAAAETDLLQKLLAACHLQTNDIALFNLAESDDSRLDMNVLLEKLKFKKVILFGVEPDFIRLPFSIPLYTLQRYNTSEFLRVDALTEFISESTESKQLKKRLWANLKEMFAL
jgi:hypothetical protein